MSSRKAFLAALSVTGTTLLAASSAARGAPPAAASASPAEPAPPSPSPAPAAAAKPSDTARAQALAMRRFDPHLDDDDIDTIARGIDDAYAAGKRIAPRRDPLRNGDEPVTRFFVPSASPHA